MEIQKKFIKGYLKDFHERCKDKDIEVLSFFGNDDVYTGKNHYRAYAELLDETPKTVDGYEFKAYGYVPIYPFSLRSACKIDHEGWVYNDKPCDTLDVGPSGFVKIDDPDAYFKKKGTIEDDLESIKSHPKLIMAIHCPPWSLSLDVCADGRRVGSKAVYDWADREQPLILLCGHIHENYKKTGIWKAEIGRTTVIQPGQGTVVYVEDEGRYSLI